MTTKDLFVAFVQAGEQNELAFRTLALANHTKTINQMVTEILNHPKSDAPRWVKGEKGCGKKAGTAKSLKTIRTENPKDWREKYVWAQQAQAFEGMAGHFKQTDGKKFVRRRNKDTGEFELVQKKEMTKAEREAAKKKREAEAGDGTSDGTRAVPVDTLEADFQTFIDAIRPDLTSGIRESLLTLVSKHDIKVTIPTVKA